MKPLLIIAVIVVLVFTAGLVGIGYLNNSSASLSQELKAMDASVRDGKWNDAHSRLNTFENKWAGTKYGWAFLLDHMEIDNIDIELSKMKEYVKTMDKTEALAEISSLVLLIEHIPEKESFSLKNIF